MSERIVLAVAWLSMAALTRDVWWIQTFCLFACAANVSLAALAAFVEQGR